MPAGYSGTPLAEKLGIVEGSTVAVIAEPDDFRELLAPIPDGVAFRTSLRGHADVVIHFVTRRVEFERRIEAAGRVVFPAGGLWIAWPKRASKVPTDMTEDVVREVALPLGLVDNKVCAISDVWSGLRVVWRRELR
jgi:bifunctional DNA-binding transcriptional regulator/antitoxin component of YhaV-PrlF toxin-antitoxin module